MTTDRDLAIDFLLFRHLRASRHCSLNSLRSELRTQGPSVPPDRLSELLEDFVTRNTGLGYITFDFGYVDLTAAGWAHCLEVNDLTGEE